MHGTLMEHHFLWSPKCQQFQFLSENTTIILLLIKTENRLTRLVHQKTIMDVGQGDILILTVSLADLTCVD